jgi:hypothetical protein
MFVLQSMQHVMGSLPEKERVKMGYESLQEGNDRSPPEGNEPFCRKPSDLHAGIIQCVHERPGGCRILD